MKPRWNKGLDEQASKELKQDFMQATLTKERLTAMLEEDIEISLKNMRSFVDKDISNLSEAYAAELAKQETLLDIIKLLR